MKKYINNIKVLLICIINLIIVLMFVFCCLIKFERNIYFNTWLFFIKQKNEMGYLLKLKDFELGYQFDNDDKYSINNSEYFKMKDINARFEYSKNDKTLKIFLDIWNQKNGELVKYSDLKTDVSKSVCNDIIMILLNNYFSTINKKDAKIMQYFVKNIKFYFMVSPEEIESGTSIGGIIYKIDKQDNNYYESKTFNSAVCSSYYGENKKIKNNNCINL